MLHNILFLLLVILTNDLLSQKRIDFIADRPGEIYFKVQSKYDSLNNRNRYLPKDNGKQFENLPKGLFLIVDTVTQIEYSRFINKYSRNHNIFNKNKERIINGHNIYVINKSSDTLRILADQGILFIYGEVFYDGNWRRIHNYGSFCGTAFRYESLPSNTYWTSIIPKYGGNIKVKMRYVLTRIVGNETPLYSNEFMENIQIYQLN